MRLVFVATLAAIAAAITWAARPIPPADMPRFDPLTGKPIG